MSSYCRSVIPALAICLMCLIVNLEGQRVDCRKFVFAPMCRGVAAKRAFSGSQPDFYLEQDRKASNMDVAPGLYPTSSPLGIQEGLPSRDGQPAIGHSRPVWRPISDQIQAQKPDTMYDWYMNNRKRARELDLTYDY